MNIEKTECDRLGYEYKSLLEQVVYALHHIPYAKDFINEEGLKKLDDLSLKLSTGNCEIIEFKRTLCKYNFTDILKEKDKEIERLNNKIKEQNLLLIEFQDMEQKVEQLENIRKEAIEYIENNQTPISEPTTTLMKLYGRCLFERHCDDLLNILNKGSDV